MTDQSNLDSKYFVDHTVYNCPFCNRRHVSYHIYGHAKFNWTPAKECRVFFVRCNSCSNGSMHLTFSPVETIQTPSQRFRFRITEDVDTNELDEHFFYSVPTSFFSLDQRIPRGLRELVTEAEGSLKSNFLTGASACARKIVYELGVISGAEGDNYEDRIKSLKTKHPEVDGEFFDTLLTIQQVTSSKVHEEANDGWDAKHLRVILASLREVLHEIFVVPELRKDRRSQILALKEELVPKQKQGNPDDPLVKVAPAE